METFPALLKYLLLVIGLIVLIKSADWLVRGAVTVARAFRISEFVIGITVVSFGTSLPELIIALFAAFNDSPDLVIGNVVGSNIANVLLVLGTASVIFPLAATRATIAREIPFMLMASFVVVGMLNDELLDGVGPSLLGRSDGVARMGFFAIFIYYTAQSIRAESDREWVGEQRHERMGRAIVEIVVGIAGLAIGGRLAVDGAVAIAMDWGMSEAFVGLTVVAIGTSLPELATSCVAAYRRNADIAVGNVVGSNIFNIMVVLGITCLARPIAYNPANNPDLAVMLFAALLLYGATLVGRPSTTIQRGEGVLLILTYGVYMVYLVQRG